MNIKKVVSMLRETGEIYIDCGNGCSRSVRVGDFRNITEDALEAIECAKFSPDMSPDAETRHWSDRISH